MATIDNAAVQPEYAEATTPPRRRVSRRSLITKTAAVAAGGIGLAALTATPAEAATGTMVYGTAMDAINATTELDSTSGSPTFEGVNRGGGPGLQGFNSSQFSGSRGVVGLSTAPDGVGVDGTATGARSYGVNAVGEAYGVLAQSAGYGLFAMGGTAPLRLGPSVAVGAPTSGLHQRGEVFVDSWGRHFLCVATGTPGTWVRPGLNPLAPLRVCDTRSGTGTPYSNGVKLGPHSNLLVTIAGEALTPPTVPVPEGASAIVGNLTVTGATATSYLTVYPANLSSPPLASNINFTAGQTVANQITVALDAAGNIKIYNGSGSVHVILDLAGFFY